MRNSLLSLLLLLGCHHGADDDDDEDKPAAAAVTCKAAEAAQIADTVEVSGVIAPPPKVDAIVGSPVAGRIAQITVEEGDHVIAGALIAVIEDPSLPAGSLEARAAVTSAQAAKTAAEAELARQQRLVDSGIGARKDLDDARAKAAAATADLDAANARSGLATTRMARREVRAPISGTVLHVLRKLGELVDGSAATPIAEVADLTVLEIHAQVSPSGLAPLREHMPAKAQVLGAAEPRTASVYRVAPAVDATTLLGLVRLRLDKSDGVAVGTAATARIAIAERPGIRVPASAVRRSLVGADEVVVCDNGVARVRKVNVGSRDDQSVELASGVKAGEQVVIDHVLGLEEGQPLVGAKK